MTDRIKLVPIKYIWTIDVFNLLIVISKDNLAEIQEEPIENTTSNHVCRPEGKIRLLYCRSNFKIICFMYVIIM